jgi:aminoglycoside phosphotransferase (APT) family kinase protein
MSSREKAKAEAKVKALRKFTRAAAGACETLLGAKVTRVEAPGGMRKSIRVYLGDEPVIVTRRRNLQRARLEVAVLHALHARGAPVPRVLAFDGIWLVQEDLGGRRLPQVLAEGTQKKGEAWLDAALSALAECQRAGREARLKGSVAVIGREAGWVRQLITIPTHLGRILDLPPPALPEQELLHFLRVRRPAFLKWDARPGNAIARDDGTVAWFDWEHAGCRNPPDDVAWMMGDEFVPDWPKAEKRLLKKHLPAFTDEATGAEETAAYLAAFGTFHMCMRLTMILTFKRGGPWWETETVLARDTVGITRESAEATCRRAARWAARAPLTEALVPWLEALLERMPEPNA